MQRQRELSAIAISYVPDVSVLDTSAFFNAHNTNSAANIP